MNRYLEKIAKAEASKKEVSPSRDVSDHQLRALTKLDKVDGLVLAHSMGSGKTLTSLLAAEKFQKKHPKEDVIAVVPASLTTNMDKEIKKHGLDIDPKRFHVVSYERAVKNIDSLLGKKTSLVILDEAHKIRNKDTARHGEISRLLAASRKRLLLTGTPSYNNPHDMAVLINQAANKKVLPDSQKEFEARFIASEKVNPNILARLFLRVKPGTKQSLKNKEELKKALSEHMDVYDAKESGSKDFPGEVHKKVLVPMSEKQEKYYNFLEGSLPGPVKWKIRMGLPLDKKESASLNSFSTGVRQVSNSIAPYVKHESEYEVSPKVREAASSLIKRKIQDKNFRGVVYSNYLGAGLKDYSNVLAKNNVSHAVYHGGLSQKEKDAIKNSYNAGEVSTLLVSSSGAEGLDLKGTKLVQVMEPHFNKKKIKQVIARGARFKSHEHLPEEERKVEVEQYLSVHRPTFLSKITRHKRHSIDEYLDHHSEDKEKIMDELVNLAKDAKSPKIEKQAGVVMSNKYLEKVAEKERKDGSWMIPAATAAFPTAAFGVARHNDLAIQEAFATGRSEVDKIHAQRGTNKKTTAALAALGIATTGVAEASRRHFFSQQNDQQAKKLENKIVKKIETTLQSQEKVAEIKEDLTGSPARKKGRIKLNKAHKGQLHKDLGVPEDQNISDELLSHALGTANDPDVKKRIQFAINARKWRH